MPLWNGFDSNDQAQKERMEKIKKGWRDAILIAATVKANPMPDVLDHYFNADDATNVADVFNNVIADNTDGLGSSAFGGIVVADSDFDGGCAENSRMIAYLVNVENSTPARAGLHFCAKAFEFPTIDEVKCDSLGDNVSGLMSTFGGIIIHELM